MRRRIADAGFWDVVADEFALANGRWNAQMFVSLNSDQNKNPVALVADSLNVAMIPFSLALAPTTGRPPKSIADGATTGTIRIAIDWGSRPWACASVPAPARHREREFPSRVLTKPRRRHRGDVPVLAPTLGHRVC
jgi:hypothetical protein